MAGLSQEIKFWITKKPKNKTKTKNQPENPEEHKIQDLALLLEC